MKRSLTILPIILIFVCLASAQTMLQVPSQYPTIQAAINATRNGDTVLVQPGTYTERINFSGKNIVLTSKYGIEHDTSYISNTIIQANNLPNVVSFITNENQSAKLIGFTIQKGFYNGGNSVYNGGGILIDGASPTISNCIIKENYISWYGGGICIKNGSTAKLISLKILNNHSDQHGGGVAIIASAPTLTNLLIVNNSTGGARGGGIYMANLSPPAPGIVNCTIVGNSAGGYSNHYGGGISNNNSLTSFVVINSIVWNNSPNQIDDEFSQILPVYYSNIQNGYSGTGNIDKDPKFVGSSSGDFGLSDNSPSIGSGIDSLLYSGTWYRSPTTDLNSNKRPNPAISKPDQGAYENILGSPLTTLTTLRCVSPTSTSKGSDFSVEIRVDDSTGSANIFGLGFDLLYTNTSYVDYVSADVSGSFLGGDLIYLLTPDEANGKVSVGLSRKAPLVGVSGGGTIIRLKFHVASTAPDNGNVIFSFSNVSANDQTGASIALSPIPGTTTIQGLSVWPGDADNSGVVTQADILPLGLYWGSTGPARSNATLQWIAQSASAWVPQAATYADANGDGVINQADVLPIGLNWGKTHSLGKVGSSIAGGQMPAHILGTPVLRAVGPASVRGKITFDVTVTLGDTVNSVSSLFGIAFVLDFSGSKGVIQAMDVTPGTFLGNDIIFFPQIDNANGAVAIGLTRKSGAAAVVGFGQVATMRFQVVNNTNVSSFSLTTRDITANDASGNMVAVQPSSSSILAAANETNLVPTDFHLEQNFPNPFNPSTRIAFTIPKTTKVNLTILDVLGRKVATLVDCERTTGVYEVEWNASTVPSGIYFYRLQAGEFIDTKRMILLK